MLISTLPSWTSVVDWEDPEDLTFVPHPSRPDVAMTLWETPPYLTGVRRVRARLFVDETFVAAASVMGPGNFDVPSSFALCGVEVRPDHRGNRYSALLMEMVQRELGTVYRTGLVSISGAANMKNLVLPLAPGYQVHVTDTVEYPLVDWSTSEFS